MISERGETATNCHITGSTLEFALTDADLERIYRALRLIRCAEEQIARIYPSDKIKSPVHLSIGQEAVSVMCSRRSAEVEGRVAICSRERLN